MSVTLGDAVAGEADATGATAARVPRDNAAAMMTLVIRDAFMSLSSWLNCLSLKIGSTGCAGSRLSLWRTARVPPRRGRSLPLQPLGTDGLQWQTTSASR